MQGRPTDTHDLRRIETPPGRRVLDEIAFPRGRCGSASVPDPARPAGGTRALRIRCRDIRAHGHVNLHIRSGSRCGHQRQEERADDERMLEVHRRRNIADTHSTGKYCQHHSAGQDRPCSARMHPCRPSHSSKWTRRTSRASARGSRTRRSSKLP